jgi:hypothetical protein
VQVMWGRLGLYEFWVGFSISCNLFTLADHRK